MLRRIKPDFYCALEHTFIIIGRYEVFIDVNDASLWALNAITMHEADLNKSYSPTADSGTSTNWKTSLSNG